MRGQFLKEPNGSWVVVAHERRSAHHGRLEAVSIHKCFFHLEKRGFPQGPFGKRGQKPGANITHEQIFRAIVNLLQGELSVFNADIKRGRDFIGICTPLAVFKDGHTHGAIDVKHVACLFIERRGVDRHQTFEARFEITLAKREDLFNAAEAVIAFKLEMGIESRKRFKRFAERIRLARRIRIAKRFSVEFNRNDDVFLVAVTQAIHVHLFD